jgi:hypothetical protein
VETETFGQSIPAAATATSSVSIKKKRKERKREKEAHKISYYCLNIPTASHEQPKVQLWLCVQRIDSLSLSLSLSAG